MIDTDAARFLDLLLRLKRPAKVLEIGTSIGYASTIMAKAMQDWGGKVVTVEINPAFADQARKNFTRWGVSERIDLILGDAFEVLPKMREKFDFIFFDVIDKLYPQLLEPALNVLNYGGIFVADDTLEDPLTKPEKDDSIHRFNQMVVAHPSLRSTLVPVGDGMTIAIKVKR